jgi:hypothetical protein
MNASSRTQAYGRTGDPILDPNGVVYAKEMADTFGSLAAEDNYFLSHNQEVNNGYVVSTTPTIVYSRSWSNAGQSIGASFLRVLQNVTTFITYAKFDTVIWTPAIPKAFTDPVFAGLVSSAVYSPSQANGLDRPGLVTITYASNIKRVFPLPLYASGHSVSMRTPADLLTDVQKWYVSPPVAAGSSATSSTYTEGTPVPGSMVTPQATTPVSGAPHPYIGP